METRARSGLDEERAWGSCRSLQSDSKARAELVVSGPVPNKYSSWFTGLNKRYYSGWDRLGAYAVIEVARV